MDNFLILMSDNRLLDENLNSANYNSLTCFLNYQFSIRHGYDFLYLNPTLDNSLSVYNCLSPSGELRHASWSKIISVLKIMDDFKNYEKIIYIDSDCVFLNTDLSIQSYIDTIKNTNNQKVSHSDKIVFLNDFPWSNQLPCAGFFITPNNEKIKNFFIKWYKNETFSNNNINHNWEQIVLQKELFTSDSSKIEVINDLMFREKPNQFLRHIGSEQNDYRVPFFKNLIKKNYNEDEYKSKILNLKNNIITFDTKNFKFS